MFKDNIIKNILIVLFYVATVMTFLIFINASIDNSIDEYGYYKSDRDYLTKLEENKLNVSTVE